MLKKQLDEAVAEELACSSDTVATVTKLFLHRVMAAVAEGRVVFLPGFGKFRAVSSKHPSARNLKQNSGAGKSTTRRNISTTVHFTKSRHVFSQLRDEREVTHGKVRSRRDD